MIYTVGEHGGAAVYDAENRCIGVLGMSFTSQCNIVKCDTESGEVYFFAGFGRDGDPMTFKAPLVVEPATDWEDDIRNPGYGLPRRRVARMT
jgi:hypothetical protein